MDTAVVQAKLNQLMPNEKDIRINAAADALVIAGTVADAIAVEKILSIANAFVRKSGVGGGSGVASGERIVNMLSIAAPQQVMLEVKVAEISKTLLDQLGSSFSNSVNRTGWAAGLVTNFLSNSAGQAGLVKSSNGDALSLDAQRKQGMVKILAEPTIMAISGQEGSFLAGGKVFIPTGVDNLGRVILTEKEFGVSLRFTPTVLDGGRINLQVAPEVSELSREGVGFTTAGSGGSAILPLITSRRASTTVQLYDGQSFAIGGLIKNNMTQNIKALPLLGEVPVLGALFRSSDFQTDRTELVFIITPRLAKPLPAAYVLHTDSFVAPSRAEFFLGGKMEGSAPVIAPAASVVDETTTPPAPPPVNTPSGFELKQ
jgi:pilus assembly protein CpaC